MSVDVEDTEPATELAAVAEVDEAAAAKEAKRLEHNARVTFDRRIKSILTLFWCRVFMCLILLIGCVAGSHDHDDKSESTGTTQPV